MPLAHRAATLAFLGATLTLSACSGRLRPSTTASPAIGAVSPALRVYDTKANRFVPFAQLASAASKVDMVFFGEQHDDPATHAAELAVLAALGERRDRVVLSVEMFERDVQPMLDQYLAGTVTEKDFLAGSRPWERYTTDYRALVELSRIRGWPVVAANVPRRMASAVGRKGLAALDTMTATERAFAARENVCPKDSYYKKFVETMSGMTGHGAGGAQPSAAEVAAATAMTDRFYEAQCVKDETMGESVANALNRAGSGSVVFHVDGAFHSDFALGTVERARRRAPSASSLVITAVPLSDLATANGAEHKSRADFVLFTKVVK